MRFTDNNQLDNLQLGQRIRDAREKAGLSQEELAAELGLGQRAISELEHGKRRLAVVEMSELVRVLNVPILYFLEDEITPGDLDQALLQHFHKLSSVNVQKTVIEIVRLLSETTI
jgi:transcriptional regulator with XRE-family HTH domain